MLVILYTFFLFFFVIPLTFPISRIDLNYFLAEICNSFIGFLVNSRLDSLWLSLYRLLFQPFNFLKNAEVYWFSFGKKFISLWIFSFLGRSFVYLLSLYPATTIPSYGFSLSSESVLKLLLLLLFYSFSLLLSNYPSVVSYY